MGNLNNGPADGQRLPDPDNSLESIYYMDDGAPVYWLGNFTEDADDSTSLVALRDMLDAAYPHLEAEGSPMTQLFAHSLAMALDEQMGVGQ